VAFKLIINGEETVVDVEPAMPLLWVLRDELGLTGTKFGCGIAACGACTVHVNGVATRTCVLPVEAVDGAEITTIEGLGKNGLHPVQQAWIEHQVPHCGYCQSGMIMSVVSLLDKTANPSEEELNQTVSNVCRCGTYQRVRVAVDSLKEG
jgi:isoquinoline 1-oxidoreductase subunit alpha